MANAAHSSGKVASFHDLAAMNFDAALDSGSRTQRRQHMSRHVAELAISPNKVRAIAGSTPTELGSRMRRRAVRYK